MTKTELIKELRALTQAGMKDCKEALEESNFDLQAAVDLVKVKGLNIADGRSGRVATEGQLRIFSSPPNFATMVEINCQSDFVANSKSFADFAALTNLKVYDVLNHHEEFSANLVEDERKAVVATTKENIVVRRWFAEEALDLTVRVFSYLHSNNKLGVLLSLQASNVEATTSPEFIALGDDLAMQIAAMNPLAVSAERLTPDQVSRQKAIFETQLRESGKPEFTWVKIMKGKMRKWNSEVCLLEQESVIVPKSTVKQVVDGIGAKLGGSINIINFIRCQVGEGVEKKQDNLAEEVAKLMGV